MKRGKEGLLIITVALCLSVLLFWAASPGSPTGLQIFGPQQFAPQVTLLAGVGACGTVLDTPGETYRVTSDIAPCGKTALRINASDITLDCRGFSLTNAGANDSAQGIRVLSVEGVTVANCSISGYQTGIDISSSANDTTIHNNTLFNITEVAGTPIGIGGAETAQNVNITYNNVTNVFESGGDGGIGMSLGSDSASNFFIAHNTVSGIEQPGIAINAVNSTIYNNTLFNNSFVGGNHGALEVTIRDNVLVHSNLMFNNSDQGAELTSSGGSNNFTFRDNIINNSGFYGMILDTGAGDTNILVSNNLVLNSNQEDESFGAAGIFVEDSTTGTVTNNIIQGTKGAGILVQDSSDVNITLNNASFNRDYGLHLNTSGGDNNRNIIHRNQLFENGRDGVRFDDTSANTSFIGNNASFNNQSGLEIAGASFVAFRDNIANNNRGQSTGMDVSADARSSGGGGGPPPVALLMNFNPQAIVNAGLNVTNNTAMNNNGSGFVFTGFNDTNFIDNIATNNTGSGLVFTDIVNVSIDDNQAINNSEDGIVVNGSSSGIFVIGNNATGNNQSGFSVSSYAIEELRNNRAVDNRGANTGGTWNFLGATIPLGPPPVLGATIPLGPPPVGMASLAFGVQALANPDTLVRNNVAINNNGNGWIFTGFNRTNFIGNIARNNNGTGIEFRNVSNSAMDNNSVSNNTLGVLINASVNNTFSGENYNDNDIALLLVESNDSTFDNIVLTSLNTWLTLNPSNNNNMTSLTLNNSNGSVRFTSQVNLSNNTAVNQSNLRILNNQLFLNSSNLTEFNVSAHIQMLNVNSNAVQVAFDDVNFVTCNAPQCTNVNLAGSTLDFDVASFSTYQGFVQGGGSAGSGGGGGGASTTICPPSCSRLTDEEIFAQPYCRQACPNRVANLETAPEEQQPTQTDLVTDSNTEEGNTEEGNAEQETTVDASGGQNLQLEDPNVQPVPEQKTDTVKQELQRKNLSMLTYLFYGIALLALLGIWVYAHNKHLKD